jgi:hypothetical protein
MVKRRVESRMKANLPDWRYRAICRGPAGGGRGPDAFETEALARLAAAKLPWCFGEMCWPHWRAVPVSAGDDRSILFHAGEDIDAREESLSRIILCSRCPVFDRCHKLSLAKKAGDPADTAARRRMEMLAALSRM